MAIHCPWCDGTKTQTAGGDTAACANCNGQGWRW